MLTEEEFNQLADDENGITDDTLLLMIAMLRKGHSDLEKEITDFYNKYGTDGVVTYAEANKWISEKNHSKRLIALLVGIKSIMDYTKKPIKSEFISNIDSIIKRESEAFKVDLEAENFRNYKWGTDDLNWRTRLDNDFLKWNAQLNLDVKQAIMRQDDLSNLLEKVNKRFKSMEVLLVSLVMTEITAITSKIRVTIYKQLQYNKYRYYTKEDERTCEVCGAMHGRVFPLSMMEVGVNAPSMHPRCRCWIEPIKE